TVLSGGNISVQFGGTASNTVLSASFLGVGGSGATGGTQVRSGATLVQGGAGRGTIVSSGGSVFISGTETGTVVLPSLDPSSAGSAVVQFGGVEYAVAGMPTIGVRVSGGSEIVSSGGLARATLLVAGSMTVSSGGIAS